MAKTAKAPKGFYTASDVMKKLGIANSTLYHYVDTGKIKKIVPPDRKEGYYLKSEIDKMAQAREFFMLQYATEETTFEKALEEDIEGVANLYTELFGGNQSKRLEMISEWYHSNPNMIYVTKQDEMVVGYFIIIPLKHGAILKIMQGLEETRFRTELLNKDNITSFIAGKTEEAFLLIGVKQGLKRTRHYGSRT
ncbi:MAG: helix-turn-helix domain-containing protein, partial [Chloroflexota bacterium]|nr:helix-turn-helix domain-containing protein [Chloroflexota bacterium]